MSAETAAGTAQTAATKPVPQAAIRAVADTLRGAGTSLGGADATDGNASILRSDGQRSLKGQNRQGPAGKDEGRGD